MQRCFFFIFLTIWSVLPAKGQIDILKTEWSFWVNSMEQASYEAQVELEIRATAQLDKKIELDTKPEDFLWVRIKEGRLKESLNFGVRDGKLTIDLKRPVPANSTVTLVIRYRIGDWEKLETWAKRDKDLLVLNPLRAIGEVVGASALFFPCVKKDASKLRVNITLPAGYNLGTLGKEEFRVRDGRRMSYFWKTKGEVIPEDFYLVVGEFKKFDIDDIEEEYQLSSVDMVRVRIESFKEQHSDMLSFADSLFGRSFTDDEILALDSLSQFDIPGFYLKREILSGSVDEKTFQSQKRICLQSTVRDTLKASFMHFLYHWQRQPDQWSSDQIAKGMQRLIEDTARMPQDELEHFLIQWVTLVDKDFPAKFLQYRWEQSDSLEGEERLRFARQILRTGKAPAITIRYRYTNGVQYIYLDQDTNRTEPIGIPLEMRVYNGGVVSKHFYSRPEVTDTLGIAIEGAPKAVSVHFTGDLPALIEDRRPETYNLYFLNNADSKEEKKRALRELLSTKNRNLFTTVLGIAMDDADPLIRKEALERAKDIKLPGQLKLKTSILKIAAEDEDPRLRAMAAELAGKFYKVDVNGNR